MKWLGWLLWLVLAGCVPHKGELGKTWGQDVTGVDYGKQFRLTGLDGRVHTLADYRGKVVVVFFGYTHCPEVCPTTLYDLSQALQLTGAGAQKIQVLFITVDPARDNPAMLKRFVAAFNPHFSALYGNEQQTQRVLTAFGAVAHRHPADAGGNYAVDHTAWAYVYDQDGRLRLQEPYGQTAAHLSDDFKRLIR